MHMPTLRDADRGIPKGGVAPSNGRELRIGVAALAAVVQLQDSHIRNRWRAHGIGFSVHMHPVV